MLAHIDINIDIRTVKPFRRQKARMAFCIYDENQLHAFYLEAVCELIHAQTSIFERDIDRDITLGDCKVHSWRIALRGTNPYMIIVI